MSEVLIHYYSKTQNSFGVSETQFNRRLAYNQNRIVSKWVQKENLHPSAKLMNDVRKFDRLVQTLWRDLQVNTGYLAVGDELDCAPMYLAFKIPKRKGGFRDISAPCDALKITQRRLAQYMVKQLKYLPSNNAHGFTHNRNCKSALEAHAKKHARWFLKMDIEDFFPSTKIDVLKEALNNTYPFNYLKQDTVNKLLQMCTVDGALPQGAPTSPILTNLVMGIIDDQIDKCCDQIGITYTRYADDLLFSSPYDFTEKMSDLNSNVNAALNQLGYRIKTSKTRYGNFNGRNWNLGLMYNNQGKITVGHARKKLVKNMLHNYHTKPECQTEEYKLKLQGILAYCKYIEPEYFANYTI